MNKSKANTYKGKIIFTGNFVDFFLKSVLLMFLSVITFGIVFPYYIYWQFKYFVVHLRVELEEVK